MESTIVLGTNRLTTLPTKLSLPSLRQHPVHPIKKAADTNRENAAPGASPVYRNLPPAWVI